jgi:preprotein translocase subunit SecG
MEVVIVLILIIAVLLVLVVLAQNSKGGGLSSQFGGAGASNIIGVKKTSDLLERLTWGFAIAVLALSVVVNIIMEKPGSEIESPNLDRATPAQQEIPALDPVNTGEGTSSENSGSTEGLEGLTDENE